MPIAMNFDLLSHRHHQDKCEHITECDTHLEIKSSKSPLSNGTNRPCLLSPFPPAVKPRMRPLTPAQSSRLTRKVHLEQLTRCSSTYQISLPADHNEKWLALASSTEHILVGGGNSSTLRLFDFQGKEIRVIDIKTFAAFDLAWSNVLNAFVIAGYDSLQTYHVDSNQLTPIEDFHLINKKDNYFWSIACHGYVPICTIDCFEFYLYYFDIRHSFEIVNNIQNL
jgi:hypothetical protein